jgi:hypothetical protein
MLPAIAPESKQVDILAFYYDVKPSSSLQKDGNSKSIEYTANLAKNKVDEYRNTRGISHALQNVILDSFAFAFIYVSSNNETVSS